MPRGTSACAGCSTASASAPSPQPALSRRPDAARAHARRLHRQRERRADAAGLPPGRARRAARRSRGSASQGYESIGILGTSLGSCLAMLTAAHEPLIEGAGAEPHLAVLRRRRLGRASRRARAPGARGPHRPGALRRMWMPISPLPYLDRVRGKRAAARLRPLRPDLPGRPLADARRRVQASRNRTPADGAALRPLQHRRDAVQVARRPDVVPVPDERTSVTTRATATAVCRQAAETGRNCPIAERPTLELDGSPTAVYIASIGPIR